MKPSATGLLNRRAFEQRFDQEVALMQRGARNAALMLIDMDRFKTVNDTLGHQAGEERKRVRQQPLVKLLRSPMDEFHPD